MLGWFDVYFSHFDHENVDVNQLRWLIRQRADPNASPESLALLMQYADLLEKVPVDEGTVKGVITTLYDLDFAGRAGAILQAYDQGQDVDPVHELAELARVVKRARSNGKADDYERTAIGDILAEMADDKGIKFANLPVLRESVAAMLGGSSVAIGARPDKGKTSLIAFILAGFAPQLVRVFGPDRPVLWLNNEGTAKRIKPRLYQAALNITLPEMVQMSNEGTLEQAYLQRLGIPNLDYIRVKDIHGASMAQCEQIIEDMRPSVVVWDMLANVRMSTSAGANKADAVEQAWQTTRELAVTHDHISLATVQVSVEGGNQLYPPYNALKDSKTGIQGATDLILIMGALDNAQYQTLRGLGTPKNKFSVAGRPSHAEAEFTFDGQRCQFIQQETHQNVVPHEGQVVAGPSP